MSISIIQPFIPHYREDFFLVLNNKLNICIFVIRHPLKSEGFSISKIIRHIKLKSTRLGSLYLFNSFNRKIIKNKIIIIPWLPTCPSLVLLLLLKKIINRKIIIWTHGISVKKGFNPDKFLDKIKLRCFNIADGIFFYTEKEKIIFDLYLKKTKTIFLNNTINTEKIISIRLKLNLDKNRIRNKYNIASNRIVIYSARFTKDRRIELLVELINLVKNEDIAFIIIGNGPNKPDFRTFQNVFDFGALYDINTKIELFSLADFAFQPAWSGLSVVEAFANGVPYITLKKSKLIFQCVEYNYIKHNTNGFIANDIFEVKNLINNTPLEKINEMKSYCVEFAKKNLKLDDMVNRFISGIKQTNIRA